MIMSEDTRGKKFTKMRRNIREVTDEDWIKGFLRRAPYGYFATSVDDRPFLHINTFAYYEKANCIYFHTASAGRMKENIEENKKTCFAVSEMGRLLPAERPSELSVEYSSVIVFGETEIIEEKDEKNKALKMLIEKYFPHLKDAEKYKSIPDGEIEITTVYRFKISEWSGKQHKQRSDHPGAFNYPYSE
ncbi:MAG: pyridoxamine 5'-phosphate oxidase family protein [candidate division Zixibacteria bacterium]|nr:pyridoxamine 5'-phosphate oxidase family protein [candidate division Zixibacteria bacterium]